MPFVAGETVLIGGATTSRCTASARRSNKEAGLLGPQPEGRREFWPISLSLVVDDAHIASSSLRDLGPKFPPQMICYSWDRTLGG